MLLTSLHGPEGDRSSEGEGRGRRDVRTEEDAIMCSHGHNMRLTQLTHTFIHTKGTDALVPFLEATAR